MKTVGSQIKNEGSLKLKKVSYDFWLKTLSDSKVRAAKDHGKKFRNKMAAFFSVTFHSQTGRHNFSSEIIKVTENTILHSH